MMFCHTQQSLTFPPASRSHPCQMAAPKKPASRAEKSAAAEMRATAAAQKTIVELMPQVLDLLAGAPHPQLGVGHTSSVALPVGRGQTMVAALKNRPNWYALGRREIGRLARLLAERNWFIRGVSEARLAVYGHGFRFVSDEANLWAGQGTYPFAQVQDDMIQEWLVSKSIVAYWRKDSEPGTLPKIHVPDVEAVDYKVIGGIPQITLTVERHAKISEDLRDVIGQRMWNCIRLGRNLTIVQGVDEEYDFAVMKTGKADAELQPSPMVTIFEDLDFVEAIRVGDWNGAKARWEIIRHTKKGYGVSSGPNAGTTRNNAKTAELKTILAAMKSLLGKTDVATNFDQEISWLTFPKEHFHPELLAETKQRLLFWSGIFGVLLLKTDSQITGLSSFMMDQLRAEVLSFREKFTGFLGEIYQSESFLAGFAGMEVPALVPTWSVKPLYTLEGLNKLVTTLSTYGVAAPQTIRSLFDIDNVTESELMALAHENPEHYTPPFEPRQGIASGMTLPEKPAGGAQNQNVLPNAPGRPGSEE